MWLTALDIVSTRGGHAGMQRSQPLQCSTSIVTVPRLVTSVLSALRGRSGPVSLLAGIPGSRSLGSDTARLPRGKLFFGQQLETGVDRTRVAVDVLRAIRRD